MAYTVIVPESIQKIVNKKLKSKELVNRFYKKLKKLERAPTSYGKPLRYPLAGVWEIYFERRWRILFKVDEENKRVSIIALKHKDEM